MSCPPCHGGVFGPAIAMLRIPGASRNSAPCLGAEPVPTAVNPFAAGSACVARSTHQLPAGFCVSAVPGVQIVQSASGPRSAVISQWTPQKRRWMPGAWGAHSMIVVSS
jgi:hypothetical protein